MNKRAIEETEGGRPPEAALYRVFLRAESPYTVTRASWVRSQGIDAVHAGHDAYINPHAGEVVVFDPDQIYLIDKTPYKK